MALEVAIETDTGAAAVYWRVIEVNLNYFAGVGAIALAGYLDQAARDKGKRPLEARQFPIQGDDFKAFTPDELSKDTVNPVSAAYAFIKAYKPQPGQPPNPFTDAKDV